VHFTTETLLTLIFLTLYESSAGFTLRFILHAHFARVPHLHEVTSKVEVQKFFHEHISWTKLVGPANTREGSQEPEASSRPDPKRPGYVAAPGLAAVWAKFLAGSIRFASFPISPECREI